MAYWQVSLDSPRERNIPMSTEEKGLYRAGTILQQIRRLRDEMCRVEVKSHRDGSVSITIRKGPRLVRARGGDFFDTFRAVYVQALMNGNLLCAPRKGRRKKRSRSSPKG